MAETLGPLPYWLASLLGGGGGVVSKFGKVAWQGDAANNRLIDMGDDYDLIIGMCDHNRSNVQPHGCIFIAYQTSYNFFMLDGTNYVQHMSKTPGINWFQGKVAASDNIKLGTVGGNTTGFNANLVNYLAVGFKFSTIS